MTLKEIYEQMSNEEVLERYTKIERYKNESKQLIFEELKKRKLILKEELDEKIEFTEKVKFSNEDSIKEKEIIKKVSHSPNTMLGGVFIVLLMMGSGLFVDSLAHLIYGSITNSWKETKAEIINLRSEEKTVINKDKTEEKVMMYYFDYEYFVDGDKYLNNQMGAGKIEENHYYNLIGKKHKNGDFISVFYNPKNSEQSIAVKYSLGTAFLEFVVSMIILLLFYLGILKYEDDYGEKVSKRFVRYMFLLFCVVFICMILMGEAFEWIIALMFLAWIIFIIFEFGKMFMTSYFDW